MTMIARTRTTMTTPNTAFMALSATFQNNHLIINRYFPVVC